MKGDSKCSAALFARMVLDLRWTVGPGEEEHAEKAASDTDADDANDDDELRPRPVFAAGDEGGVTVRLAFQDRKDFAAEVAACVELLHDVRGCQPA
jgi:hypothetical protein